MTQKQPITRIFVTTFGQVHIGNDVAAYANIAKNNTNRKLLANTKLQMSRLDDLIKARCQTSKTNRFELTSFITKRKSLPKN